MSHHHLIPRLNGNDIKQTGFYTTKNSNTLHLRVQESHQSIDGIIRLNKSKHDEFVFEGYNGWKWVQFNSQKGEQGDTGNNFSTLFDFVNCEGNISNNNYNNNNVVSDTTGLIFKTLNLDGASDNNDDSVKKSDEKTSIQVRSITGGTYKINENEYPSIDIKTYENEIRVNSLPQPYSWDFSKVDLSHIKSKENDEKFKSYGDTSLWRVKKGAIIKKGQCVRLHSQPEDNKLVITPIEYSPNVSLNLFNNPKLFLGIALEDCDCSINSENAKNVIEICTYGITTTMCNIDSTMISSEFMSNNNITELGLTGLVSSSGLVFNSPIKPLNDYIKAGHFLEIGNISKDNRYLLFFVEN